ncbi:MAG: Fe-S cluster assembly protein SufD [Gemmatimonadales bacterium]|nr:Fe-S cluster assembly protein SufD [Gemmatimonadales bacterium]
MTQVRDESSATGRYVTEFESFAGNGASVGPAWLRTKRESAIASFAATGFPHSRQEAWRFTDVKPIAREGFALAPRPTVTAAARQAVDSLLLGAVDQHAAVFVNGYFVPELSSLERLPQGVKLGSIKAAMESDPELLEKHLTRYASEERNPFTALSTAFISDGGFVHLAADVVLEQPLQLVFLADPVNTVNAVWHPRNLVIAERGAEGSVVESYVALRDGTYWTNAVTEVVLGDNAKVDTYRVQRESTQAYHTATSESYQARDSVFKLVNFTFGGQLSRQDINAVLDGEGADCTLDGLSMLDGSQHTDHHTTLEHAQPHCTSWEYFNGVFDDNARGVFTGRIVVRPGAQRTDSKQTNNNLLLSESARADSQPQLEIYADDVKCTHGATLGPIDDDHLFYLESRGLTRDQARQLLTYGFASEILSVVKLDELKQQLDGLVRNGLAG